MRYDGDSNRKRNPVRLRAAELYSPKVELSGCGNAWADWLPQHTAKPVKVTSAGKTLPAQFSLQIRRMVDRSSAMQKSLGSRLGLR